MNDDAFLSFWDKARPSADRPAPCWHPVAYHLLDMAAVMGAILDARSVALRRGTRLLRLDEEEARRLLVVLAGLHDLGKFAPAFQIKDPLLWNALRDRHDLPAPITGHHTEDGFALWLETLADEFYDAIWPGVGAVLEQLAPAVFGHHGRPGFVQGEACEAGLPAAGPHRGSCVRGRSDRSPLPCSNRCRAAEASRCSSRELVRRGVDDHCRLGSGRAQNGSATPNRWRVTRGSNATGTRSPGRRPVER